MTSERLSAVWRLMLFVDAGGYVDADLAAAIAASLETGTAGGGATAGGGRKEKCILQ